ncbi:MAG: DNA repair protein RadC [Peptococcaceae bacterium]|nr:DNA repair protein RadC [Peptococcaceae bacterium]MBQ7025128.1 DNA repair protein RadC [Peptococcaceae bacterium]
MTMRKCKLNDYPEQFRPRERMELLGAEKLTDVELLAILLSTGNKETNVLELASNVLQAHKGITGLQDLTLSELTQEKGIGKAKATTILAAVELGKRVHNSTVAYRPIISNSADAGILLESRMRHLDREHFCAVLLSTNNAVIGIETISIGTLTNSLAHPREVFKQAIRQSASTVVLAHNHPSGDCLPSDEDLRLTERLAEAGQIIGIHVIDHIIVGEDSYYSFSENGLL